MTNHPNRSTRPFRFIAFTTIGGNSLAHAASAREAIDIAVSGHRLADTDFLECLDCGSAGRKVWDFEVPLYEARRLNRTVFRGAGYAHMEPVALAEEGE